MMRNYAWIASAAATTYIAFAITFYAVYDSRIRLADKNDVKFNGWKLKHLQDKFDGSQKLMDTCGGKTLNIDTEWVL